MNETTTAPPLNMGAYYDLARTVPYEQVDLLPPRRTPTRWLSPVERATVRVSVVGSIPLGRSLLHNVATRFAIMQELGTLQHMAGEHLARQLTLIHWPSGSVRTALRGWELLRAADESSIPVEVWLSTLGLDGYYGRMRLHERAKQLIRPA